MWFLTWYRKCLFEFSFMVLQNSISIVINTLRFLLSVCLSVHDGCGCGRNKFITIFVVRDGCGRGRNEIAGRVQNYHMRFSFHRNSHIFYSFLRYNIVEATAGLDTLRCRLREGCHCGRLPSYYRRARTQDYLACWTRSRHDFSLLCFTACIEQG